MALIRVYKFTVMLSLDEAGEILTRFPRCAMESAESEPKHDPKMGPPPIPLMAKVKDRSFA